MSAGAESLSQAISQNAMHTQVAHPPEFSTPTGTLSAAVAPTSGGLFAVEGAHAGTAMESATAIPPAAATSPTMFAAPMAPAAPMAATPPPMAPVGPLPAYGADLRPATPTITASPDPDGQLADIGTGQPVQRRRRHHAARRRQQGRGGAHVGLRPDGSHRKCTSPQPLPVQRRARYQPRVPPRTDCGASSRPSHAKNPSCAGPSAIATTAPPSWSPTWPSGWIPPHVEIPTGVHLSPRRSAAADSRPCSATRRSSRPGPRASTCRPTRTSTRSRCRCAPATCPPSTTSTGSSPRPPTGATDCRGSRTPWPRPASPAPASWTPRLTCSASTCALSLTQVLKAYPESVDAATIGNWQLLAAIDALVTGQKTALNYHFAWFQALHMATQRAQHEPALSIPNRTATSRQAPSRRHLPSPRTSRRRP